MRYTDEVCTAIAKCSLIADCTHSLGYDEQLCKGRRPYFPATFQQNISQPPSNGSTQYKSFFACRCHLRTHSELEFEWGWVDSAEVEYSAYEVEWVVCIRLLNNLDCAFVPWMPSVIWPHSIIIRSSAYRTCKPGGLNAHPDRVVDAKRSTPWRRKSSIMMISSDMMWPRKAYIMSKFFVASSSLRDINMAGILRPSGSVDRCRIHHRSGWHLIPLVCMSDMHMLRIMIECGQWGGHPWTKAQSKLVKEVEYTRPLLTLVKQNTSTSALSNSAPARILTRMSSEMATAGEERLIPV